VYETAKYHGTKVELISSAKISTGFAEAPQSRNASQADDVEEASPPSSPSENPILRLRCLEEKWSRS
jgi:hypothetical protein